MSWPSGQATPPPTSQSITQSTVRDVLYTHYERLVRERLPVVVLMGPDNDIVWSLLQRHPRKDEKIGSGISLFVLSRNVKKNKNPGFFVARTDGTVVDFAIKKVLHPSSSRRRDIMEVYHESTYRIRRFFLLIKQCPIMPNRPQLGTTPQKSKHPSPPFPARL